MGRLHGSAQVHAVSGPLCIRRCKSPIGQKGSVAGTCAFPDGLVEGQRDSEGTFCVLGSYQCTHQVKVHELQGLPHPDVHVCC